MVNGDLLHVLPTWITTALIVFGIVAMVLAWAYLVTAFLRAPQDPDEQDPPAS